MFKIRQLHAAVEKIDKNIAKVEAFQDLHKPKLEQQIKNLSEATT